MRAFIPRKPTTEGPAHVAVRWLSDLQRDLVLTCLFACPHHLPKLCADFPRIVDQLLQEQTARACVAVPVSRN